MKNQCGRSLDVFGHHLAACATVGVLDHRDFPLKAQCLAFREAGGRVFSVNVFVRDLDIAIPGAMDNRWNEAGAPVRTNVMHMDRLPAAALDSKFLPMACLSAEVHNWQLTQRWSLC